jgi:hypothetical protein
MTLEAGLMKVVPIIVGIATLGAGYAEVRSTLSDVEATVEVHETEIKNSSEVIVRVDERTLAIQKQLDRIERALEKK